MRLEEFGAHHGTEGQGHYRGNDHRHGDSDSELAEKLSCDSREEAHRHKHGAQHQRHRHKRSPDPAHRFLRRLVRRQMLLGHYPVHILHDHYGIIHHDTYRKDEPEQSHHIQGEPEHKHNPECPYQGYRDRYRRNQGRPPALQGQEDHQNHQQQSLEQSPVDMMYGFRYISGHIERDIV